MADGHMTKDEREAFLAGLHVGVLAVDEPGRGPLALPIWYLVDDGDVLIRISTGTLKARLLTVAGRATMAVQDEAPPYKYLSVEGPVTLEPATEDALEMATRYLGPELGRWYADENASEDTVIVRLRPEHWRTYDFAKVL